MRKPILICLVSFLAACGSRPDVYQKKEADAKTQSVPAIATSAPAPTPDVALVFERQVCQKDFDYLAAYDQGVFTDHLLSSEDRAQLKVEGCDVPNPPRLVRGQLLSPGSARLFELLDRLPNLLASADANKRTIFHRLVNSNDVALLKVLQASRRRLDHLWDMDHAGQFPLHEARSEDMVDLLLGTFNFGTWAAEQVGVPPNPFFQRDQTGATPLVSILRRDEGTAAEYLVNRFCRESGGFFSRNTLGLGRWVEDELLGNVLNVEDNAGRTPLHWAAVSGNLLGAEALVSCTSTDAGRLDKTGRTALHYAALQPDFAVGLAILLQGTRGLNDKARVTSVGHIDVNARDIHGDTALHWAYRCHNSEAIRLLQRFAAEPSVVNSAGDTAASAASAKLPCPKVEI